MYYKVLQEYYRFVCQLFESYPSRVISIPRLVTVTHTLGTNLPLPSYTSDYHLLLTLPLWLHRLTVSILFRSGICGMSIQRAPSTAHSTPRATPHPHSASPHPSSVSPHPVSVSPLSDDVVRIHVTYNPLAASPSRLHPISPSKRFDEHSKLTLGLFTNGTSSDNRIRIQVPSEDLLTPVVDSGRIITQHYMDKDVYDLK